MKLLPSPRYRQQRAQRVASASASLAVTAAVVAISLVAGGLLGSWAASQSTASAATNGGTVSLSTVGSTFSTGLSNLAPDASLQRIVSLKNAGSLDFSNVTMTLSSDVKVSGSGLQSDFDNSLSITVDRCSSGWSGWNGGSYSCTTWTTVVSSKNVLSVNDVVASTVSAGTEVGLRITYTIADSAPNALQSNQWTVNWSFTATQRTATTL